MLTIFLNKIISLLSKTGQMRYNENMKDYLNKFYALIRKNIKPITVVFVLLTVDMVTKMFFDGKVIEVIENIFSFTSTHNTGAGFGVLSDKVWLLILISAVFLAVLFVYNHFEKNKTKFYNFSFGLIIAGAIGNFLDRIFLGYVRDFIFMEWVKYPLFNWNFTIREWRYFPIFNFADICLTVGIILFSINLLFLQPKRQTVKNESVKKTEEESKTEGKSDSPKKSGQNGKRDKGR